ncbi:MAG: DUF4397 domain-containing protein [Gemmatimonadetes bacterium]|nr:DUF4397 domain-containing protein [Gemmatimonadota bacterium]
MRLVNLRAPALVLAVLTSALGSCTATAPCCTPVPTTLTIVNAFGGPVDVRLNDKLIRLNMPPGVVRLDTLLNPATSPTVGFTPVGWSSILQLRPVLGSNRASVVGILRATGGGATIQQFDDSNAVVAPSATKLRVLHLAANTGEVQVWRTQPDLVTPTRWAFPFTFNSVNSYLQSTVGTWTVKVWTDVSTYPAGNPTPWTSLALDAMSVTLNGGEKGTIAIVDKPGGGIALVRIE